MINTTFREFLNEGFKSDKNSMLYANGKENAYRIYVYDDDIVFAVAKNFGYEFVGIKKIPYDLDTIQAEQKKLKKEYKDLPSVSKGNLKQIDDIHFNILKGKVKPNRNYGLGNIGSL